MRAAATPACAGAGDGADDCVTDVLFTVDADPQADWRQEVVRPAIKTNLIQEKERARVVPPQRAHPVSILSAAPAAATTWNCVRAEVTLQKDILSVAGTTGEAQFERGDKKVIALAASLINANEGTSYPESGYSIRYMAIPPTPAERQARSEEIKARYEIGLASPVDFVLASNPGMDRAEAAEHLEMIRRERSLFPDLGGRTQ